MPTHNDETLHDRYAREHETELAIMAKMKPEEIYALSLELHNTKAACDTLHAEAEALRVALLEIASANPAERGIEWAKSYASDGLKGAGSELYARWLDSFNEAEALRAENGRLTKDCSAEIFLTMTGEVTRLRTDLEAARGLLAQLRGMINCTVENDSDRMPVWISTKHPVIEQIDAFLTATIDK